MHWVSARFVHTVVIGKTVASVAVNNVSSFTTALLLLLLVLTVCSCLVAIIVICYLSGDTVGISVQGRRFVTKQAYSSKYRHNAGGHLLYALNLSFPRAPKLLPCVSDGDPAPPCVPSRAARNPKEPLKPDPTLQGGTLSACTVAALAPFPG